MVQQEVFDEQEYQKAYQTLKTQTNLALDEIKTNWLITQKVRIDEIEGSETEDLLENWPLYTSQYAPVLVSMDFRALHPEKQSLNENFYYFRWNMLRTKILPILNEMIKDKVCRKDLQSFLELNHETEKSK